MKRIHFSTIAYATLAIGVLLFAASLIMTYAMPRSSDVVRGFVERSPYPMAIIGYSDVISFRTLAENMRSIKQFYESQDFSKVGMRIDFSTDEGQKRFQVREKEVINKMIEDQSIIQLAREQDIVITPRAVREGLQRKLEEYGTGDEVKKNLSDLYGWTLGDFEQKVVLPSLYEEKLRANFEKEVDVTSQARGKIDAAQVALRQGKDFSEIAKQYSEGQTAKDGGNLGWFTLEDLALELRTSVALQKVGVPGGVIESSLGFHIVLVEEVKKESNREMYRLKQIFTKKIAFADWLSEKMKSLSIVVLSPEYQWNSDEARVEFKSQQMRDFEKNLFNNTSGDAMFFF